MLSFIEHRVVKNVLPYAQWPKIILLFINLTRSVYAVCSVVSLCSGLIVITEQVVTMCCCSIILRHSGQLWFVIGNRLCRRRVNSCHLYRICCDFFLFKGCPQCYSCHKEYILVSVDQRRYV